MAYLRCTYCRATPATKDATVFCPRCGNNNDNDARFCFSCGERFQQGNQPAGPSGPQWGQFQEPAPPPPPASTPVAPPPPPSAPRVVRTQIAPGPRPSRRDKPLLAGAIIAVLTIAIGAAFFLTQEDGKPGGGQPQVEALSTKAPGGATPGVTPSASPVQPGNDGPVVAPGYRLTAIFVPPQGSNDTKGMDQRLYDAIVQGVDWNDSAKVYGRRYPLQYVFQNATANLLLKPPNVEQAKRSLASAGYSASLKPKFLLSFNPSDRPFANWLSNQMTALGFNVVADANNFTADEKAKGYHGLIISILPA